MASFKVRPPGMSVAGIVCTRPLIEKGSFDVTKKGTAAHEYESAGGRRPARKCLSYLLVTLMVLGLTSSCLGMIRVRTPFSKVASALSGWTGMFRRRERLNFPYARS